MPLEALVRHNCLETLDHPFGDGWRVEDDRILPDMHTDDPGFVVAANHLRRWLENHCTYGDRAATRAELTDHHRLAHFHAALDDTPP
ncbi:MAG: hypothetical protein AAF125_18240, partial [Chloroflexota bacterium]